MKSNRFVSALLSACRPVAAMFAGGGMRPQPLVAALCICVLGEGDDPGGHWPPQSLDELMQHMDRTRAFGASGLQAAELSSLLEEGLAALDEASRHDTGRPFPLLDRTAQLRAVFRVESGRMSLTRRRAAVFVDAFLTLAAQAYLRGALEVRSH